jgi:hypothetical protein
MLLLCCLKRKQDGELGAENNGLISKGFCLGRANNPSNCET